jgi:hypothetical protein
MEGGLFYFWGNYFGAGPHIPGAVEGLIVRLLVLYVLFCLFRARLSRTATG